MKTKKIFTIILIVISFFSCVNAQVESEIYLVFREGKTDICNFSMYRDGSNKKELAFSHEKKTYRGNQIFFKLCNGHL